MARIARGEIRWANLDPTRGREQAGHRPVLVLSNGHFNSKSTTVIAAAITSSEPKFGFPLAFRLPDGLLPKPSWVKTGQVRVLAIERLGTKLAHLELLEVNKVIEGLLDIIG